MPLTLAQLRVIRDDILANPDLSAPPNTLDGEYEIARLYNLPPAEPMAVWRTETPVTAILDGVDLAKYTPADVPLTTDLPAASATWLNRSQNILIKQGNLILLTQGREKLDTSKVTIRNSVKDAITAIPAGVNGANTAPGGASGSTVMTACTRFATRIEKLLAIASQGSDTTGSVTARVMGFEGHISPNTVHEAKVS